MKSSVWAFRHFWKHSCKRKQPGSSGLAGGNIRVNVVCALVCPFFPQKHEKECQSNGRSKKGGKKVNVINMNPC